MAPRKTMTRANTTQKRTPSSTYQRDIGPTVHTFCAANQATETHSSTSVTPWNDYKSTTSGRHESSQRKKDERSFFRALIQYMCHTSLSIAYSYCNLGWVFPGLLDIKRDARVTQLRAALPKIEKLAEKSWCAKAGL